MLGSRVNSTYVLIVPLHKIELENFRSRYWDYYRDLLLFKKCPIQKKPEKLSNDFDVLFSTKTNYQALNDRIEKTKEKKSELLLVLKYPEIPLHNNDAELGGEGTGSKTRC